MRKKHMDSSAEFSYPRLIRRIQALLIDSLLLSVCALGTLVAVSHFGITGAYAALCSGLVVFLLEPVLVSSTGGTIGHHLRGLRVIHPQSGKRLNVLSATFRFLFKALLGWLSLITYFTTKRYQAIHDLTSSSVVVLKRPLEEEIFEKLGEIQFQIPGYRYPSVWRRIIMVVFYNLLFTALTLIGVGLLGESACQSPGTYCSEVSSALGIFWQIGVVLFLGASIYYCRSGRIYGCKRKPVPEKANN